MPTPVPASHAAARFGGVGLILVTLLSWASVPLFLKWFTPYIDPWTANGWRYGISALFWLPVLLIAFRRGRFDRRLMIAALGPTAFNIVGQITFAWCPYLMDPGFFTFVFRVQIVFVTLGAFVLFPAERAVLRRGRFWLGVLLVAGGSCALILLSPQGLTAPQRLPAVLLAVGSGVLFAGYGLAVRRFMHGYPAVYAFGVICQYTAVAMVALMLVLGRDVVDARGLDRGAAVLEFSTRQWLMLVLSAMLGIALSHASYYAAIQRLGVTVSMGIIQLQPVLTATASTFIFGEVLTSGQWASGLVGVAGALLILSLNAPAAKRAGAATEEREGS